MSSFKEYIDAAIANVHTEYLDHVPRMMYGKIHGLSDFVHVYAHSEKECLDVLEYKLFKLVYERMKLHEPVPDITHNGIVYSLSYSNEEIADRVLKLLNSFNDRLHDIECKLDKILAISA